MISSVVIGWGLRPKPLCAGKPLLDFLKCSDKVISELGQPLFDFIFDFFG